MNSKSGTEGKTRGGARAGAGRRPVLIDARQVTAVIDAKTEATLRKLGAGKLGAGIRLAASGVDAAGHRQLDLERQVVALKAALSAAEDRANMLASEIAGREYVTFVQPNTVVVHPFHAREDTDTLDYERLKNSMQRTGRNEVPVLLRRRYVDGRLELIAGRRRLHVALERGLPLASLIRELSDREAMQGMAIDSGWAAEWSVWERGTMLRRALEFGLYPSVRYMADDIGWLHGEVHLALAAANLPKEVVAAFLRPSDILGKWVEPLSEAVNRDRHAVLATAAAFAVRRGHERAKVVYAALTNAAR